MFSSNQEQQLVKFGLKCMNHYYGISVNELKELAYQFAKKLTLPYPRSWEVNKKAGQKWFNLFMKRHPELALKFRIPGQTSSERIRTFCKDNVAKFFDNLKRLIDQHHFNSSSIYNMNETGFSTVPAEIGKAIASRHIKKIGKLDASEHANMATMAFTICANGKSIPPFFLFPRKHMQSTFLDSDVLDGTVAYANDSGRMHRPEFVRFLRHFIRFVKPSPESPVLLLLDSNYASHLSVDSMELAAANGVHMLSFPPRCSHKLQPFDVSVYRPLKSFYKKQCIAWQRNNANKALEFHHVAGLVCSTLDMAITQTIIKSGFVFTGIAPFDQALHAVNQNSASAAAPDDDMSEINLHDVNHQKEFVISEPWTIRPSSAMSFYSSSSSTLDEIGSSQATTPKNPTSHWQNPIQSTVLTSTESFAALKMKTVTTAPKKVWLKCFYTTKLTE